MLVIISDLHLTDGTSGASIHPGAFYIFADRLQELAERAGWRSSGRYQPVEKIDLVLLGDIIDVVRSSHWVDGKSRPWDDPQDDRVIHSVSAITGNILQHNAEALGMLRGLAVNGAVCVPPVDMHGRPVYDTPPQPVQIRTHYMIGNHDWHLHVAGGHYDGLRRQVAQHLGLANEPGTPFPHDPSESDELLRAMRNHQVFARHGDIYDPINFEGDRDQSSLGDIIVVELVSRFAAEVFRKMGDELPQATIDGLAELDNIRPLLLIPVWIEGLLERSCPCASTRKRVKKIWDDMADHLLSLRAVRERDTWSPFDIVDGLSGALKFSRRVSLGWASRIVSWLQQMRGCQTNSYGQHAIGEQDFRNRRAQHIVYGHTHEAESLPLDASYADGYVLNQMYFNTGTWRRVHRQTQLAPGEHEFIAAETMSYLAFFQGDEQQGRPFESWSGTLGVAPPVKRSVIRSAGPSPSGRGVGEGSVSPSPLGRGGGEGQVSHASEQPLSASNVWPAGPHFTRGVDDSFSPQRRAG